MTGPVATILLVDDEKVMRTLLRIALEQRNLQVLEASNGKRAQLLARRHGGPIHLLLTEISLPQGSGLELAETLVPHHPRMQVIFLSSRSHTPQVRESLSASTVLKKPFDLKSLLALIDDRLRDVASQSGAPRRKPPQPSVGAAPPRPKSKQRGGS